MATAGPGAGGRSTMTTGIPSFRAATSLATVAVPPEFLVTTASIRWWAQQARLVFRHEGAARGDRRRPGWQVFGRRRVDATDQVEMRGLPERRQILAADGEEHAPRLGAQRIRRGIDVGHARPTVARRLLPGRTQHRETGDSGGGSGGNGIGGNRGGEGVGGVQDRIDPVRAEITGEPVRAAEAADPGLQRRRRGGPRHPGERQGSIETIVAGDRPGQGAGLAGSAEQKDFQP